MRKVIVTGVLFILSCIIVGAQDTLIFHDGRLVLTEVLRVTKRYVVHRTAVFEGRVPLSEVEVRMGAGYLLRRPWTISGGFGFRLRGSEKLWESIFRQNDFDSPHTSSGGEAELGLDYRYLGLRSFGVKIQWFDRGSTTGRNNDPFHKSLNVWYRQRSLALYHRWQFSEQAPIQVYAGPSISRTSYGYELHGRSTPPYQETSIGLTCGVQLLLWETMRSTTRLSIEYAHHSALQTVAYQMQERYYGPSGYEYGDYITAIAPDEVPLRTLSIRLVYGIKTKGW